MKTTRYFDEQVLRKRPNINPAWCVEVIAALLRREEQPDGRFRFWGPIAVPGENAPRILRAAVALLQSRVTVAVCRDTETKETTMKGEALQDAALKPPPDERTSLARRLLRSRDEPPEEELAETWLSEADRRAREIDCGEARPVSAEEVRRKARALLQ